jgi:Undecaprenyl-phosphate galactose phosphotransferase WbaP
MSPSEYAKWFKKSYIHTSSFYSGALLMLVDALCVMLCFGASFFIINLIDRSVINFKSFVTYWIYLPAFLLVFYGGRLYPGIMLAPADEVRRLALGNMACFTGIALSVMVETDGRDAISIAMVLAIPIAVVLHPAVRDAARKLFSRLKWWGVPSVVYANNAASAFFIERLKNRPDFGYKPAAVLSPEDGAPEDFLGVPVFKPGDEIHAVIKRLRIKTAIVVEQHENDSITNSERENEILSMYRYVFFIPYIRSTLTSSISTRDFGGILAFATTHHLTMGVNLVVKRLIDLFLILVSSPLVLPVILITALCVKATSPGPVFYGHTRIGYKGKPIKTWKFRSMVRDADAQVEKVLEIDPAAREQWEKNRKIENDPRITPLGKFLRRTSLDELPQLFNILLGEMSFVGPRPVTNEELENYGYKGKKNYVLSVKPGLSGMWQISGRSETGYEERVLLDSYYIQNWSIWLDIWIIIQTVWVVLNRKGAY